VLTARPQAYPEVELTSIAQIPSAVMVKRAFALDAARHLSVRGRYFSCTALPDRWGSWVVGALPAALKLIRQYKPDVIWSTYPIPTAHIIGAAVQRLTGIPWIADFRDPMVEYDSGKDEYWPPDPRARKVRMWIERLVMKYSTCAVFVTAGALQMYAERFPQVTKSRLLLIPNGYDEESFVAAGRAGVGRKTPLEQIVLLHSGGLYPGSGRDTSPLFAAVATLRQKGLITAKDLRIVLRASEDESNQQRLIIQYGLEDIVFLKPPIPYIEALAEMLQADGLLLLQGALTHTQIPAKVYEYIRAQRPILALVDMNGDAAALLRALDIGQVYPFYDQERITQGLHQFLAKVRGQQARVAEMSTIVQFSRRSGTHELARVFDEVSRI
jgi:glycosyltransferase involved in cell wall biosynthesis